jgi:hypothetical protein
MTGPWKAWKTNSGFPRFPPPLGNRLPRDFHIPTASTPVLSLSTYKQRNVLAPAALAPTQERSNFTAARTTTRASSFRLISGLENAARSQTKDPSEITRSVRRASDLVLTTYRRASQRLLKCHLSRRDARSGEQSLETGGRQPPHPYSVSEIEPKARVISTHTQKSFSIKGANTRQSQLGKSITCER